MLLAKEAGFAGLKTMNQGDLKLFHEFDNAITNITILKIWLTLLEHARFTSPKAETAVVVSNYFIPVNANFTKLITSLRSQSKVCYSILAIFLI